jgi:membrane protease YdiL (CAAX protease family)
MSLHPRSRSDEEPFMTLLRHSSRILRRTVLPPKPPTWRGYWILFLPVLLILLQLVPLGLSVLGLRLTLAVVLSSALIADLLIVGVAAFVARRPEDLGLVPPRRTRDLVLLPIGGAFLSFVGLYVAEGILTLLRGEPPPPQRVAQALAAAQGPGLRILAVATVGLVAPFAEEVVFRGVSFRGLRRRLGFFPAAAVSSVLFSLAHLDLQHGLQLFVVGIVLAWTVERSGSIFPGIVLHAVINLTSLLMIW